MLSIVTRLLDNLNTSNEPTNIEPCRTFDIVSIVPISASNPLVGRLTVLVVTVRIYL